MTAVAPAPRVAASASGRSSRVPMPVDDCVDRLERALDEARAIGLDVADAETVLDDARMRLGFPGDTAVIALVGGTGVGKSTLLNAIAGAEVSPASARRPTTASPVAWLPADRSEDWAPLLEWLGVAATNRRTRDGGPIDVAVLDLPDLDSIEPAHRQRVDEILPRVDAVVWVTDPEKYHDAVLHDDVLDRWLTRLGRQLIVVNKADRLPPGEADRIRRDLERDVARIWATRSSDRRSATVERPAVVLSSAVSGHGGIDAVSEWLAGMAADKAAAAARILASIRETIAAMARGAGLDPQGPATALLSPDARRAAEERAADAMLRAIDVEALERQAVAATRARARARGAGPLGGLTSRLFRWSGREARTADPAAFLVRWRGRGTPGAAAAAVREAMAEPLRTTPPAIRAALRSTVDDGVLERRLGTAVDRAIADTPGQPPLSRWWPVIGFAQTLTTGALVLTAIWVGLWIVIRFPVDSALIPVIGRVPIPLVALLGLLVMGFVLARLLGAHAGWLGRTWASALSRRIRAAVRAEVAATAFRPVDAIDTARQTLWMLAREAAERCP